MPLEESDKKIQLLLNQFYQIPQQPHKKKKNGFIFNTLHYRIPTVVIKYPMHILVFSLLKYIHFNWWRAVNELIYSVRCVRPSKTKIGWSSEHVSLYTK